MPKFNSFGGLEYLTRNPRHDAVAPVVKATINLAFRENETLWLGYGLDVATHLGGASTSLDFELHGRRLTVTPSRSSRRDLPKVNATTDKATVDFQSATSRLPITGHPMGMTLLDAIMGTVDGVSYVTVELPSNLTCPDVPHLTEVARHPFEDMSVEDILARLRADMLAAEAQGLTEWEIEDGRLFGCVVKKNRIG